MKNKSFLGRLISFSTFMYLIYVTLRDHGYWEQIKSKIKEEMKNKKKYNNSKSENGEEESTDWMTIDAEEVLRQRFAGGEIDEEEFNSRMEVLKR